MKGKWGSAAGFALLCASAAAAIFPFYMMIIMSTYRTAELYKAIRMIPGSYYFKNLATVIESGFMKYYVNSFYIAFVATLLCAFVSSLAGYGLAKFRFRLNKPLYFFTIASMMIPMQLGLIGYVIEMRAIHLANTREAVIAMFVASSFGVFWMTQFIRGSLPTEVVESARIDGCGELRIFFSIVLAYIRPGLATLIILSFMWNWNNYLLPLVILTNPELYPLTLGIASLGNRYTADYAAQITALGIGTLPLILVFILGSRYFIRGLTAGDIKG